jgi:hypothetical protein
LDEPGTRRSSGTLRDKAAQRRPNVHPDRIWQQRKARAGQTPIQIQLSLDLPLNKKPARLTPCGFFDGYRERQRRSTQHDDLQLGV